LINIVFTSYQLYAIPSHEYAQHRRTLLASIDVLVASFVSNAVVITSLLQDKGYKKTKYKYSYDTKALGNGAIMLDGFDSKSPNHRTRALTDRWGSDEDLMRTSEGESKRETIMMNNLGVAEPERAKMSSIRVAQTWEVDVEDAPELPDQRRPTGSLRRQRD
jgi:hypothetical protein